MLNEYQDRDKLIVANLKLCRWAVGRLRKRGSVYAQAEVEDLTAAAQLGLVIAANTYDRSRGTAFSTWAWSSILYQIQQAAVRDGRLPVSITRNVFHGENWNALPCTKRACMASLSSRRRRCNTDLFSLIEGKKGGHRRKELASKLIEEVERELPGEDERRIWRWLSDGHSSVEIADLLQITKSASAKLARHVKYLARNIVTSRLETVQMFVELIQVSANTTR